MRLNTTLLVIIWATITLIVLAGCVRPEEKQVSLAKIEQLTTEGANAGFASCSPDGKKIAFGSDRAGNYDVWIMDSSERNQEQLTTHESYDSAPSWSPDGRKIVFISDRTGNYNVWVTDSNGSNQRQLTTHEAIDQAPDWSPDGKKIVFLSNRTGSYEVWALLLR